MKLHNYSLRFFLLMTIGIISHNMSANVSLTATNAPSETLATKINNSASALLTEINNAYNENRALNLAKLNLAPTAISGLSALWENVHFYCDDTIIVQPCLSNGSGYQVRQIPLIIKPQDGDTPDDNYQEGVINFDRNGKITRFNFTLSTNVYSDVIIKGKDVTEITRRQQILSYVEQFRTAYNEKDIVFLNHIFSDDALIITGTVTKVRKTDNSGLTFNKVSYKNQSKAEYLANLKRSFSVNKWINVNFDEVKVVKHPTMDGFYGVTVHQLYSNSHGYSDDGYLFMLWDFRDKDNVEIHVRTWQPRWMNEDHTEEIAPTDIFTVGDFVIDL